MIEPIFFDIPIYRCSKSMHSTYMKIEEQKFASSDNFNTYRWYSWKYNEIIGYLNLYIFGSQFRSDIWIIDKKRINKGIIKKKFKFLGKMVEKEIPRNKSSNEIFEFIIESIVQLNKKEYKKYHFDLKALKVIGQFVDWVELTSKLNSFSNTEYRKKYFEDSD